MYDKHYLTALFEPRSVAVVGATEREGAVGSIVLKNLLAAKYCGHLFAVNPHHATVHGVPSFPALEAVPERIDLAVVITPATTVPQVVEDAGRAGVRAAVVITAGFGETGPSGTALQQALLANAQRYGVRLVGPNCIGIMRPEIGLNATFAKGGVQPGPLALVSQSGALCTAILNWAQPNGIGFSSVISLGGSIDIDFGEILDYLVADPKTEHILLYVEGVRNARAFMSALRAASRVKPVLVLKAGRHAAASRAVRSHSGALVGTDDVFDAALRRAGVVRVATIGQLFAAAAGLSAHIAPRGNRLAIITNGGGPGAMAADRAADLAIPLAELSQPTLDVLKILRDRAVALPPLNELLIRDMVRSTRVAKLLGRFRNLPPIAMAELETTLLRVSEMVCELPELRELDINPLVADETGVIAVDARIVVGRPHPGLDRYGHMAIHPYPAHRVHEWQMPDGAQMTIRPIRPEDAEIEREFVKGLSPESKYFRFMDTLRELTPQMIARFTQIDYDREMAFIAVAHGSGKETEVGVCRYITNPDGESCEFAVVIADAWQGRGTGGRLMSELIAVAREKRLKQMVGHVLASNSRMLKFVSRLGFTLSHDPSDPTVKRAVLALQPR